MTGEQQVAPNEFIVSDPSVWTVTDRWMTDLLTHDIPASVMILLILLTQLPWWARLLYVWLKRR
jgi:hypothetical protein